MRKIMLVGRSECGKTSLRQALRGDSIYYHKTQYINHYDAVIDTPGEYAENAPLCRALALYSYECDVIGLLLSAAEPYSLYSPCIAALANRPMIGIVTQADRADGDADRAERWLGLTGCSPIFRTSAYTGEGIWRILDYLREDGDVLPWETEGAANAARRVLSDKNETF